jgi:hypothetical protein
MFEDKKADLLKHRLEKAKEDLRAAEFRNSKEFRSIYLSKI